MKIIIVSLPPSIFILWCKYKLQFTNMIHTTISLVLCLYWNLYTNKTKKFSTFISIDGTQYVES